MGPRSLKTLTANGFCGFCMNIHSSLLTPGISRHKQKNPQYRTVSLHTKCYPKKIILYSDKCLTQNLMMEFAVTQYRQHNAVNFYNSKIINKFNTSLLVFNVFNKWTTKKTRAGHRSTFAEMTLNLTS